MAAPTIDELVSQGKVANNPKIIDYVKSGKITPDEAISLTEKLAAKKQPETKDLPAPSQGNAQGKDVLLNDMVDRGELVPNKKLLDYVKTGKITLDEATAFSKKYQEQNGSSVYSKNNSISSLKGDPKTAINKDTVAALGTQETVDKPEFDFIKYGFGKLVEGALFGVYNPTEEMEAPDTATAVAGFGLNLIGGFMTGGAVSSVIGKIPLIAKMGMGAVKAGEQAATLKNAMTAAKVAGNAETIAKTTSAFNKAKNVARLATAGQIAAEGAITGAATGAARTVIEGDLDPGNILANSIAESAMFVGGGLALAPVMGAAGKFLGRNQAKRATAATNAMMTDEAVQATAKAGVSDDLLKSLNQAKADGKLTKQQAQALMGIEKIKATGVVLDPYTAMLANPALTLEQRKSDLANMAKTTFLNPEHPFNQLYKSNPALETMVNKGQYDDAFMSVRSFLGDEVKKEGSLRDVIAQPFLSDAETVHGVVADRILRKTDQVKYPNLSRSMIVDYKLNPTEENALLLAQNGPRGFVKKVNNPKFLDARVKAQEADILVDGMLEKTLGVSSGKVSVKDLPKLKQTDQILKTAITFNKDFSRTLIGSFNEGVGTMNNNFAYAEPEMQEPLRASVNIKRMMTEKSELMNKKAEMAIGLRRVEDQLKRETDPSTIESLTRNLTEQKKNFAEMNQKVAYLNRGMRGESAALTSLSPEKLQEVNDFVSSIYIPPKQADQNTTNYLKLFGVSAESAKNIKPGDGENPFYIRKDSDLADALHAYSANGMDLAKPTRFELPFVVNIKNPIRQMEKELGFNHPITLAVAEKLKGAEALKAGKKSEYLKLIETIGIKRGSQESSLLQRLAEGDLVQTSDEFQNLPQATKEKLLNGAPILRKVFDDLLGGINAVMEKNNLPKINVRKDYVHHFQDVNETLPDIISSFLKGENLDALEAKFGKGSVLFKTQKHKSDPNRIFFGAEIKRSGSVNYESDAIGSMMKYLDPALERIYYTDLVREIDVAKQFAPTELGGFLQKIKDNYLLKRPDYVDLDTSKGLKTTLKVVRKRMAEGALFWNVNTALQQVLSMPMNFAVGGMDAARALPMMFTKEGKELAAKSVNLKLRDAFEHTDLDERFIRSKILQKFIPKSAEQGYEYYKNMGKFALETFDKVAAKHAFLTGYNKAMKIDGMTKENAIRFGDKVADMIHADMSKIGQPDFMRSTMGKAFFQFQSFVMNYSATIMHDLPNMARTDGAAQAVSTILRTYAGMSLANEAMRTVGAPAPFDPTTFIPIGSTYRFGAPGMFQAIKDFVLIAAGNEKDQATAKKDLTRFAATLAFPGGGAIYRGKQAVESYIEGEYKDDNISFIRDLMFGKKRLEYERQDAEKVKKGFGNRVKKSIANTIQGK